MSWVCSGAVVARGLQQDGFRSLIHEWPYAEMKLFLSSSARYGKHRGSRVPFPSEHVGVWWNVWDVDDLISYRVADIIEGVDETAFHVGRVLHEEHLGYLSQDRFYSLLAERVAQARTGRS